MSSKILGKNKYGWWMLRLSTFCTIPAISCMALFGDVLIFFVTKYFYGVCTGLGALYGFYKVVMGVIFDHAPSFSSFTLHKLVEPVGNEKLYESFSLIAPYNYEIDIYRTLTTDKKMDNLKVSVDLIKKKAFLFIREETFSRLKSSPEEFGILLHLELNEAYKKLNSQSVFGVAGLNKITNIIGEIRNQKRVWIARNNSQRNGVLVGAILGVTGGEAEGLANRRTKKYTLNASLAIFALFAFFSITYTLVIMLLFWFIQLPYNRKVASQLKHLLYIPAIEGIDKKEEQRLKDRIFYLSFSVIPIESEYVANNGWSQSFY